jgi:DNA-binding protein YbaB
MRLTNKLLITILSLAALMAGAWAQTAASATPAPKKKHAAAPPAQPAVTVADIQALKDALAAQQQQIQQLTQQLQQSQQAWQQAQQQLQQTQAAASDAQQKAVSVQAAAEQQQNAVAKLSSDMADVRTSVANTAVASQDEQKKLAALESAFGRFRLAGDMRVRGEDFFQQGVPDRNRARIRARLGLEGQLGEDFNAGVYIVTGSLADTSANETLTNFFDRKTVGLDRGFITYNPVAHKWLSLTGGKFLWPWTRTSLTFKPDINPEGFDAKLSFDTDAGPLRNFNVQTMWLPFLEVAAGPDSYAAGGSVSGRLDFLGGRWTLTPSYTLLNWHNADAVLSASAFAVQSTSTGVNSTGTTSAGNVPGEGPGCAKIQNVPSPAGLSFPPCVYAPAGMTNSTFVTLDSKGNPTAHFLSRFLYSDLILNNQFKTGLPRLPANFAVEYEENLNAASNPYDVSGNVTGLGKQNKAYGFDFSVGRNLAPSIFGYQARPSSDTAFQPTKNDVQVGYSWWRVEQDAIISSWGETDSRAPSNVLQNRIYVAWKPQKNVTALYTLWLGRTLNPYLENNTGVTQKVIACTAATPTTPLSCPQEPTLKRQQIDLIYTF